MSSQMSRTKDSTIPPGGSWLTQRSPALQNVVDALQASRSGWVEGILAQREATGTGHFLIVGREITRGCGVLSVGHRKFLHEGGAGVVVFESRVVS